MTNLYGGTVCGKRDGKSFKDALRPTSDGICPEMTTACSFDTKPENTICVSPDDKLAGLCPITNIQIMSRRDSSRLSLSYTTLQIEDDVWLVYSKIDGDNLPI